MKQTVECFVKDLVEDLAAEAKTNPDAAKRTMFYNASRLLTAYNELFYMNWQDVEDAEYQIRAREADREAGHPWIGYE